MSHPHHHNPAFYRYIPFAAFMVFIGCNEVVHYLAEHGLFNIDATTLYYLYPLQILVVAILLIKYSHEYQELNFKDLANLPVTLAICGTGLLVFFIWIQMDWAFGVSGAPQGFNPTLLPGNFFTVVQIGVNSVAILAGILGEKHVSDLLFDALLPLLSPDIAQRTANIGSFLVVTLLFIQFADLIPKRVAMTFPEACAVNVIGPMLTLLKVFKPVVWVFNAAADAILKLLGIPTKPVDQITTEDIAAMVDAGAEAGVLHKHELHLIENVFELDSKPITAIMTPRDDVVFLTLDESADSVRRKLVKQPHAQYPVCGKTIDDVLGCMDSKAILQLLLANENASVLDDIGKHYDKNVLVIPDTLTLSESLTRFREMHESFAVVMNEYGLVVGIVTLDDSVGALMGDILYSSEDEQIVRRDATSWLVDGLTPLVDLKKALELDTLPGEDYVDTAAGLVIYSLKRIPKKSESIIVAGFRFEVLDIDHHKIDQLLVSRLPAQPGQASETPGGMS